MLMQSVPTRLAPNPRIGILLNSNARRVRPSMVRKVSQFLSTDDIYFSRTLEEADEHLSNIYQKGYDLLFTAGGDGTLLQCLTTLRNHQHADSSPRPLPTLGVLPLGTGNAVASVLGGDKRITPTLQQVTRGGEIPIRSHHWVETNGKLAPFAGIGVDSMILNHYKTLYQKSVSTPFSSLMKGLLGYLSAITFYTIPSICSGTRMQIKVINQSGFAYLLGPEGDYVKEYAPGEVLFEGAALICAASTIPYYGFYFTNFPFARSGRHMQLRIATTSVAEILGHLPSLWRGVYRSPNILDFHADHVKVFCKKPLPLQIGGDAEGCHKEFEFQRSQQAFQLADLSPKPLFRPIPTVSGSYPA